MHVSEQKEIEQIISESRRILITTRGNPGFDEVASALAWYLWLKELKKERVDVVADIPDDVRNRFKFLPGFDDMKEVIQSAELFVIRINISKTKAKELSYDVIDDTMEVRIRPDGGRFTPQDISFKESTFTYDLIIVLGTPELQMLGSVFDDNRELFFHTPIINIDRASSNVRFGQVNAIYLTTTSLAELTYEFVKATMNRDIATCLLAGLIAATNSFQTPQVTPDTLRLASELIIAGASREDIVNHLFRTKDMDRLRLWGKVLSRLQQVDQRIVYSHLTHEDLGTIELNLQIMVDELVLASPDAHIVLFFYQKTGTETMVYVYGRANYDLPLLFQKYSPTGNRKQIRFMVGREAIETEREVLEHLKQQLRLITY